MHPSGNLIALFLVTLAGVVCGDQLENLHKLPSTDEASYAGGHSTILSLPYRSIGEYKNSYKAAAAANSYTTTALPVPTLYKSHYPAPALAPAPVASSYNPSASTRTHHDIVPIVKQDIESNNGDGSYSYSYETANGISASEYGVYKPGPTNEEGIQSASGSFSYTGPDNVLYTITYTAGEEGFVPRGAHIPTPPPIPEAIQKVLQYAGENAKYNRYEEQERNTLLTLSKYTSALPTPYSGYNPNYNKVTSLNNLEYQVQDDFTKK